MARARRITLPFFPHYVRQMAATPAFTDETDYRAYLHVLGRAASRHHLSILAYSLQPTEAHLLVLPVSPATLSRTLAQVNREYSLWRHIRSEQSERIWSGRFQSCAFDRPKLWAAIRFLESGPAPHSSRNMHHSGEDGSSARSSAVGGGLWTRPVGLLCGADGPAVRSGVNRRHRFWPTSAPSGPNEGRCQIGNILI